MKKKSNIIVVKKLFSKYALYIAFIVLVVFLSFSSPVFLTSKNLINVLRQISVIGIISIGMTFVIITGGIDLSVGSLVAITSVVATSFATQETNYPLIVAIVIGLLVGLVFGVFTGFFVAKMNVPPFIATLATMTIARGFAMVYSGGRNIINVKETYSFIGKGSVGGLPVPVIIFVTVILIGIFLLRFSKFGRHVYAVGGNENAAIVSGISAAKVKFTCYVISGLTSAIAAIVLSARIRTGQPAGGLGYELDAITAVAIGGTSLSGGVGSIFGTVIGMLIIGVMTNGLDLLNVSSYYQQVIKGVIILVAVLSDRKKGV
jgi:ribose/xylose/arabinose/galactoside ABC-type transport system permease subunit